MFEELQIFIRRTIRLTREPELKLQWEGVGEAEQQAVAGPSWQAGRGTQDLTGSKSCIIKSFNWCPHCWGHQTLQAPWGRLTSALTAAGDAVVLLAAPLPCVFLPVLIAQCCPAAQWMRRSAEHR